jgi:hypothetical protein
MVALQPQVDDLVHNAQEAMWNMALVRPDSIEPGHKENQLTIFALTNYTQIQIDPGGLHSSIRQLAYQIQNRKDELLHANCKLLMKLNHAKGNLAQLSELCITGSVGFWIALGLLAVWSKHNIRETGG